MGENIRVAVRLRPLLAAEIQRHAEVHWLSDANKICHVDPTSKEIYTTYCYDKVFNINASNKIVFNEMVEPLIQSAMKGFNVTIFAYGQTASGKTYTMTGSPHEHGMIQLAVQQIFACIENTPEREFLLRVSYIEIYNEQLNDLLAREKKQLKIQEQAQNNVQVVNLIEREVNSFTSVLDWMAQGDRQRRVGFTNMNERSSRSHAIFRIIVESRLVNSQDEGVQVSHINLVDLAGSEKTYQANTTGERFREGCAINQSLSTLSLVIKQLSDGEEFANFRDSKLTHLLRSSLGGNALTAIICAVTPCAFEETKSTLNFATRAKKVCNKAEVNEILSEQALLKRYLNQIRDLEKKLKAKDTQEQQAEVGEDIRRILEEKDLKIRELNEKLVVSSHRCLDEKESLELTREMRRMTWGGYRPDSLQTFGASRATRNRATELKIQPVSFLNETAASIVDNTIQEDGFVDAAKFFNTPLPKATYVDVGVNTDACPSPVKAYPSTPAPQLRKRANDLEEQLEMEKTTRLAMETSYNELLEFTRIESSVGLGSSNAIEETLRSELQQTNDRLEQLEKEAAEFRPLKEMSTNFQRLTQENSSLSADVEKLKSVIAKLEKDKEDTELAAKIRLDQQLAIEAELRRALEDAWKVKPNHAIMDESICLPVNGNAAASGGFSLADELKALEEDVTVSGPAFSRKKRPSSMLSETLARMDASALADDIPSEAKIRRLSDVDEAEDPSEEVERIRLQLAGLQSVLLEQEQEYDRLIKQNNDLQQRLLEAESRHELAQKLEAKIKDLGAEIQLLQGDNEKLKNQLTAVEKTTNEDLQEQLSLLAVQKQELQLQLDTLQTSGNMDRKEYVDELERKIAQLESEVTSSASYVQQLSDLKEELQTIAAQLLEKEMDVETLTLEKEKYVEEIESMKSAVDKAASLQEQLASLTEEKEALLAGIAAAGSNESIGREQQQLIEELQSKITGLENERTAYLQELKKHEAALEAFVLDKEKYIHENEVLKAEVDKVAALQDQLVAVTAEKETLLAETLLARSEKAAENEKRLFIEDLQKRVEELETEKAGHVEELEKQEGIIEDLVLEKEKQNQELEALKADLLKLDELQDRLGSITAEKEALLAEIALARSRECLKKEQRLLVEDLQKKVVDLETEKTGHVEELDKQARAIEALILEKDNYVRESEAIRADLEQIVSLQDRLSSVTAEKEALLEELSLARSKEPLEQERGLLIEELRKKVVDLETDKATCLQDLEKLEAEKLALEAQLVNKESEMNALLIEKSSRDLEIDLLRTRLEEIQRECEETQKLRADYEDVKCKLVDAGNYRIELEQLRCSVASIQAEKEAMIADSEIQRTEQEKIQEELQSSIDNLTNKIMELEKENEYATTTKDRLSEEIVNLKSVADSLAARMNDKELEIHQLIAEKDNYTQEISNLRMDLQQATEGRENDQNRLASLRTDLETVTIEKDMLLTELAELRSRQGAFEALEVEHVNLKQSSSSLTQQLEEAQSRTSDLESLLQETESELSVLRQQVQHIGEQNATVGEENRALRTEVEEIHAHCELLESQKNELSTKLKESYESASQLQDLKQKAEDWDKLQEQFEAFESRHGKRLGSRLAGFYNCFVALECKLQLAQEQLKTEKANFQKKISSLDVDVERYKTEIRRLRSKTSQSSTPVLSSGKSASTSSPLQSANVSVEIQTDPIQFTGAGSLRWQMESYYADNRNLRRKCENLLESHEGFKKKLMKYYNLYHEAIGKPDKMIKTPEETMGTAAAPSSSLEKPDVSLKKAHEVAPAQTKEAVPLPNAVGDPPLAPVEPVINKQQPVPEQKLPPPPECKTS